MPIEEVPLRTYSINNNCVGWALRHQNQTLHCSSRKLDFRLGPVSILLYVDDLVITGADLGEIDRVKLQLAASFDMKDLGDLHYFLGIEVICTPEGILISQHHWVKAWEWEQLAMSLT